MANRKRESELNKKRKTQEIIRFFTGLGYYLAKEQKFPVFYKRPVFIVN